MADAPVEVQPDELQPAFQMQRQAAFDAVPEHPRSCPGPGVNLCKYHRWFLRPADQICSVFMESPHVRCEVAENFEILHGDIASPSPSLYEPAWM